MIEVQGLEKIIKGRTVLSDISFEIQSGECVALIVPKCAENHTAAVKIAQEKGWL